MGKVAGRTSNLFQVAPSTWAVGPQCWETPLAKYLASGGLIPSPPPTSTTSCKIHISKGPVWTPSCGWGVHRSVKNFSQRRGSFWGLVEDEMENDQQTLPPSGVFRRSSFLFEGLRLSRKLWPPENFPSEKCCHVDDGVNLSSMLEVLRSRGHGCSLNPNRT